MTSTIQTALAAQINKHYLQNLIQADSQEIIVIGVDGPTAAGKTILADNLATQIQQTYNRPCWVFRLDWTLASRNTRLNDLEYLKKHKNSFKLESELHMRLEIAENFLKEIYLFNQKLLINNKIDTRDIQINNLYSRENFGKTTGQAQCKLQPGLVVLVEGHYTLAPFIDPYVDFNILLLGSPDVFLQRKIDRVKTYRDPEETKNYYWRVDMPSFRHHLSRFYQNADLVIDNSDYKNPRLKSKDILKEWLLTSEKQAAPSKLDHEALVKLLFSSSQLPSNAARENIRLAIDALTQWDRRVGEYLRLSLADIDTDLSTIAKQLVENAGFEIKHTNALHNVYYRKLPITLGIRIAAPIEMSFIADAFQDKQRIQIIWAGGYYCLQQKRMLGAIDPEHSGNFLELPLKKNNVSEETITVITPTTFTIPRFLKPFDYNPVFSGHEDENMSASEALQRLSMSGGAWIHRFARFSELNYFIDILKSMGAKTLKAGNYLIAVLTRRSDINEAFDLYAEDWRPSGLFKKEMTEDENKLDAIVNKEREACRQYVQKHCPDFLILDGYLQCPKFSREISVWHRILPQIALMLKSPSRLLRKRITQFIQLNLPEFSLPANKLWKDLPTETAARISLEAYTSLSPSILAEVYLWLALRDDCSAILGANIYDIRKNSSDCHAYIEAASERNTAVVLQGSLNALGHKEDGFEGYLKPKHAAEDLISAARTAARDLLLTEGKEPPLFGIGLDHVDATNDQPPGRARRFLKSALASGNITHCVLDGSALFHVDDDSNDSLASAYKKVTQFAINLLDVNEKTYLIDKEICSGELNYVGKQTEAMLPTADNIALFTSIYQTQIRAAGLGAFNTRPTLFIGNLGTTHHNFDSGTTAVHRAKAWRNRVKRYNFVSAVLHGTTNSHPTVLKDATVGCHKINVAGDLLHTLVNSLPKRLQDRIKKVGDEPKKSMHLIRDEMNKLSHAEMHHQNQSLKAHCRTLLDTINSPQFDPLDIQYFRYMNYQYSDQHVQVIIDELKKYAFQRCVNKSSHAWKGHMDYQFSASLIEVPFDEHYKTIVDTLWKKGIRYFHIDVGDGKFISREFSGLEKTKYIKEKYPEANLHAHMMVEDPHLSHTKTGSIIEEYILSGCNAVAVHLRAFSQKEASQQAFQLIRNRGARPGIIIETSDHIDENFWSFIKTNKLDWVVAMGVPVGYGGQIFDMSSLKRISALHQFSVRDDYKLLIEMDGGLTKEIIPLCQQAGAQIFAGWSIIKADTDEQLEKNVNQIYEIIK